MGLKKGIATILAANLLNLVFQLITNFFLPKYLTIECYAEIKTFQLYVSYVGVLHLGYCDGIYIKYGGHSVRGLNLREMSTNVFTLALSQIVLTLLFLLVSFGQKNIALFAFAMAILPLNIASYYKLMFQATGEFDDYAKITNATTILTFVVNMLLLLFRRFSEYYLFLLSYVVIDFILMVICLHRFNRRVGISINANRTFSMKCLISNIQAGFFLMLGNFSSIVLTGMDRWFIKALMDNTAFAMYSFAVSMENMMNVAVTPVSTTLYNYFCSHKKEEELRNIKGKIILFAAAIVACAFPAKFILETFLTKYLDSTGVIFYLFGAQIFYIIVKCFYVNLYKAQKKQKIYFAKLIGVIVVGFLFNAGLYAVMHTKEAFAIGTMLCGVVWYILSEMDFKALRSGWNENLFLILAAGSYMLLGTFMESLIGLIIYVCLLFVYSVLFMRKDVEDCTEIIKNFLNRNT